MAQPKVVTPHPERKGTMRVEACTVAPFKYKIKLSKMASKLKRSPIRAATMGGWAKMARGEEVVSLAGGLPHPSLFPATEVTLTLKDGTASAPLDKTLQYHSGGGLPQLRDELTAFQKSVHPGNYDVILSIGCTDSLVKCLELLTNPGDVVLAEDYSWPGFLAMLEPRERSVISVKMDDRGPLPESLAQACEGLEPKQRVFYTTPTGQNPTGVSVDLERRKQIYEVCRKYDLVILEDDPYYFLALDDECGAAGPLSFLSMDTDGRVVRLDSTAKILAPGWRLGWISGPAHFCEKAILLAEGSTQFPCGLGQSALLGLLSAWGNDGLDAHLRMVQREYKRRRDVLEAALRNELNEDLAVWRSPTHGMFLWVKFPQVTDLNGLQDKLIDAGIIIVPGHCFASDPTAVDSSTYVRLTFAFATDTDMKRAAALLGSVLRDQAAAAK